jgi:hypothetical protein
LFHLIQELSSTKRIRASADEATEVASLVKGLTEDCLFVSDYANRQSLGIYTLNLTRKFWYVANFAKAVAANSLLVYLIYSNSN